MRKVSLLAFRTEGIALTPTWYTISELSTRLDVTPRTIRYYEELGLLQPERQQNRRQYTERDRVRLQLILRGRRLGFSLSEIQDMLDLYAADPSEVTQLRDVLRRGEAKLAEVEAQIRDLEAVRIELSEWRQRMASLLAEKTGGDRQP